MGAINYTLTSGILPITCTLIGSNLPTNVHYAYGNYSFPVTVSGDYILQVVDNSGCSKNYPEVGTLNVCQDCPDGWIGIVGGCQETLIVPATPPVDPKILVKKTSVAYTNLGIIVTDKNWNLNGTALNYTRYHQYSNNFWNNQLGNSLVNGILNKCAVWSETVLNNQDVGFSNCFDILVEKVYYLGLACDNYVQVKIDGQLVMQQDQAALNSWLGQGQFDAICHKFWYIYPITLTAGQHIIEAIGHNNASVAGIGIEIYDIEPTVLMTYNSYAEMGMGLIFSTKDLVGGSVDIGSNGQGYTCPEGYLYSNCDGVSQCYKITTEACGLTTTTTTTTTSTTTTTTTTFATSPATAIMRIFVSNTDEGKITEPTSIYSPRVNPGLFLNAMSTLSNSVPFHNSVTRNQYNNYCFPLDGELYSAVIDHSTNPNHTPGNFKEFDTALRHTMRYLVSSVDYTVQDGVNPIPDLSTILANSTEFPSIVQSAGSISGGACESKWTGQFTFNAIPASNNYIYIIYDYRE